MDVVLIFLIAIFSSMAGRASVEAERSNSVGYAIVSLFAGIITLGCIIALILRVT